ncbi:DNA helicase RecQ [Vagococcus entomophilus]|uniref:DNA helicase RecQ n=1 Tax=Vagococcus entomophilus TaxID=1160095 RepID=A0A430AH29_9ENTE|nr:DNA helicase RecQ [Vagococcus entomophilus]RSU07249.1 DNA helicase RecQ [Vagococcus entomophilus]
MLQTKEQILHTYFGFSEFRDGQAQIVEALLSSQDVIGIMPTGAGKSICYQVPALMLEGLTIVVSPLISLMKDQVSALTQNGIAAAFLNSTLSPKEQYETLQAAQNGAFSLLYVAPEQLCTPRFLSFSTRVPIAFVSVDEAHCVSQWGQDFRPSYLSIHDYIDSLPRRPIVAAFTATATDLVKKDIIQLLHLNEPFELTTGFDRKNLFFGVQKPKDKFQAVVAYLKENEEKSGIIYCSSRKNVEDVCERLDALGYPVTRYHAGLSSEERKKNQELFVTDNAPLIVATNAFGMGIDKSNVAFVIHYNMPKNIESYYQEAGRAGRDGSNAECILFYSGRDVVTNQYFIDNSFENQQLQGTEAQLFKEHEQQRLKKMSFYCFTQGCLRQYLLRYFGDERSHYCGNCSNCLQNTEKRDITVAAQKIISCVKRMRESYGIKLVIDVLRGSKQQKIKDFHLDLLSTYGIMQDTSTHEIRKMIEFLLAEGFLDTSDGQYPVLKLGFRFLEVLQPTTQITMHLPKETLQSRTPRQTEEEISHPALYAQLQVLRRELADAQHVPAYVVFNDATLKEMCRKLPDTETELSKISGVGEVKLEKYGQDFLTAIQNFQLA